MRLKRGMFAHIAASAAVTAVVEILFNRKIMARIKNRYVSCRDYCKRLACEGADAYKKGRESVNRPDRWEK